MNTLLQVIAGASTGDQFGFYHSKEMAFKQGENYYGAALYQSKALMELGTVIYKFNQLYDSTFLLKRSISVLCNIGPLLSIIPNLFFATVKLEHYPIVAKLYNDFNNNRFLFIRLPTSLNANIIKFSHFFTKYNYNLIRTAMIGQGIAFIILGNKAYGTALLTMLSYHVLDNYNIIPRKISLLMEKHLTVLTSLGLLLEGIFTSRIINAVSLGSYIWDVTVKSISAAEIIDQVILLVFSRINLLKEAFPNELSLKQIYSPLKTQHNLNYQQMEQILYDKQDNYEINPAYYSYKVEDFATLPQNFEFSQFLYLFDQVKWDEKYELLKLKLAKDDQFIQFLADSYPEIEKLEIRSSIDSYILKEANKKNMTSAAFLADHLRQKMVKLVDVLNEKARVKGEQQQLEKVIFNCCRILPYLESLKDCQPIQFEDILLKLAIEAGDYCALGVLRVTNELENQIVYDLITANNQINLSPVRLYEKQILLALNDQRQTLVQQTYITLANQLIGNQSITGDIHVYETLSELLGLGFLPLEKSNVKKLGFSDLLRWRTCFSMYRNGFYDTHKLEMYNLKMFENSMAFSEYIVKMVNESEQLSEDDKEKMLEIFTEKWSKKESLEKFTRLVFFRLGIIRKKLV